MKEAIATVIILSGLAVAFFNMGHSGQAQAETASEYCQMVGIWKSQSNLPFEQRTGWPDYNSNYNEVCK
jgi:hypothetical protein